MTLAILGLGTAVPPASVTQQEAEEIARSICCREEQQEAWLPHLFSHTGIAKRHLCLGQPVIRDVLDGTRDSDSVFLPRDDAGDPGPTTGQRMEVYRREAPAIAIRAARQALAESRLPPSSISHLVTVSCTGFHAPGFDVALIRGLDLPPTTERTHVGFMGCHGALNGLRVARAFLDADPNARVLLCAVELCSLHYHYGWDPQKVVANALFADGAAALVAGPVRDAPGWQLLASGSCLMPDSDDAMSWTVGDHGFVMTLSKQVPALIARHLRRWLCDWLAQHDLSLDDVRSWAIHPGGPRILDAAIAALNLPDAATHDSRAVFAEFGNMSSPTVLFILDRLRRRSAPRPCVALGFGPGLTVEAGLLG